MYEKKAHIKIFSPKKKNLIFIHVAFMYISSTGYGQPR